MVSTPQRVVIAGADCAIGEALVAHYRRDGAAVSAVPLDGIAPAHLSFAGGEPIDIAIFTDGFDAPGIRASAVTRAALRPGFDRLAYAPFRLANLLRPGLAAAGGKLVLTTRGNAGMTVPDPEGRYLERPFRAAANALWRSISVEWKVDGIAAAIVVIDGGADIAGLTKLIPQLGVPAAGCPIVDLTGQPVPF